MLLFTMVLLFVLFSNFHPTKNLNLSFLNIFEEFNYFLTILVSYLSHFMLGELILRNLAHPPRFSQE